MSENTDPEGLQTIQAEIDDLENRLKEARARFARVREDGFVGNVSHLLNGTGKIRLFHRIGHITKSCRGSWGFQLSFPPFALGLCPPAGLLCVQQWS